jgi:hypothetical protein
VNQQGTFVVLPAPPKPMLEIARYIAQELAQKTITEKAAAIGGGKDHGR